MTIASLLVFGVSFCGCAPGTNNEALLIEVPLDSLTLQAEEGLLYQRDVPFTGTAITFYPNGEPARKTQYEKGKREGKDWKWSPQGKLSYEANYVANKLDGQVRSWWFDGQIRSESHFVAAKADGKQRQWYKSGALFKELNLKAGKEVGMQKAYRENGELYANYEARNGRFFGLRRGSLCFALSDEEIVLRDDRIKEE